MSIYRGGGVAGDVLVRPGAMALACSLPLVRVPETIRSAPRWAGAFWSTPSVGKLLTLLIVDSAAVPHSLL